MELNSVLDRLLQGRDVKLPSLPAVALKILEVVQKDDFSVKDLASIISADPALTAQTLRIANSPLYSPLQKVESIERAVSILGVNTLKNIALSFVILDKLKECEGSNFDYDFIWRRVVTSAVAAETIVKRFKLRFADAFVTALLMDIGVILIADSRPEEYEQVLGDSSLHGAAMVKAEQKIFGFDHNQVGMEFLKEWGLPESIYLPIGHRNEKDKCPPEFLEAVKILRISDIISKLYHYGNDFAPNMVKDLKNTLIKSLKLETAEFDSLLDDIAEKTIDVLASFNIPTGGMKPYTEILQNANEELSNLNVSYENIVKQLQEANEKAERLAGMQRKTNKELQEANKRLMALAFKDSLTGLNNHRYFYEIMDKEISRSKRYGKNFSLVMFDLDDFKPINDTLGHKYGDEVLKRVSRVVDKTIRDSDFAARIGGDEFTIILPDTKLNNAVTLSERLRIAIERLSYSFRAELKDKADLKFSISVGVGVYRHDDENESKEHLIHEVDMALYRSKKEGRNMVTIVTSEESS